MCRCLAASAAARPPRVGRQGSARSGGSAGVSRRYARDVVARGVSRRVGCILFRADIRLGRAPSRPTRLPDRRRRRRARGPSRRRPPRLRGDRATRRPCRPARRRGEGGARRPCGQTELHRGSRARSAHRARAPGPRRPTATNPCFRKGGSNASPRLQRTRQEGLGQQGRPVARRPDGRDREDRLLDDLRNRSSHPQGRRPRGSAGDSAGTRSGRDDRRDRRRRHDVRRR